MPGYKDNEWLSVVIIPSLFELIAVSGYTLINEIQVDASKRRLLIKYYNLHEGTTSIVLGFQDAKVVIVKGNLFNRSKIRFIRLWTQKSPTFEVSIFKDGYSRGSLNDLAIYFESATHPAR